MNYSGNYELYLVAGTGKPGIQVGHLTKITSNFTS